MIYKGIRIESMSQDRQRNLNSPLNDRKMVEAAGIEPASRKEDFKKPTCLVSVLNLEQ